MLEGFALSRGLETPAVYSVVFFRDLREVNVKGLRRISEDVFVDEQGAIIVKTTDILPLLVERIASGYYALCLLKSGREPRADEARRLAVADLLALLSSLTDSGGS